MFIPGLSTHTDDRLLVSVLPACDVDPYGFRRKPGNTDTVIDADKADHVC